jgi:hypothetical protein
LKKLGQICDINKNIISHLARHTFATYTLTKGVSIESVFPLQRIHGGAHRNNAAVVKKLPENSGQTFPYCMFKRRKDTSIFWFSCKVERYVT